MEEIQFDAFEYWLGDEEKEKKLNTEFAKFGKRKDGSYVAVWLKDGKNLSNAPVVLIGSEGELGIIAPAYLTFLWLSCMGYDMYQLFNFEKDGSTPWKEANQFTLDYLQSAYQLPAPENIQALIDQARADNQNVQEYISSV